MTTLVPSSNDEIKPRPKYQEILGFARSQFVVDLQTMGASPAEIKRVTFNAMEAERRMLRKRYDMPHGFAPYDRFARSCAIAMYYVLAHMREADGKLASAADPNLGGQLHMFETFKDWVGHKQPLVACTAELGQALLNTDPPDSLTYQDIKWPYASWVVALPQGMLKTPSGADLTYVMIKVIDAADRPDRDPTEHELEMARSGLYQDGRGKNLFELVICSEVEVYWRSLRPLAAQPMAEFMRVGPQDDSPWDINLNASEDELIDKVVYFITSLAMFLSGQPEDLLDERLIKTIKPPKSVRTLDVRVGRDELWSPHIVGRRYTASLTAAERDAHDRRIARTHWRRGHWRTQRHGQGFSLTKTLWIKPMLVNTGNE